MPPQKKAKSAKANNDELEAVQEQYVALFGKLPGGQWGSNLEHLKRKIAEAHGVDLTGGGAAAAATAAAPAAPTVTSKRIDAIQAEIDDPGTHARYINALIEQRDLLIANRKIEKKKNRAAGVVADLKVTSKKAKVQLKEIDKTYAAFRKDAPVRDEMGFAMKKTLQPFAKDPDFYEHAERCLKTIIAYRKASIASVVTKNRYEEEKYNADRMDQLYKQRLARADEIAADLKDKKDAAELTEKGPGRPRMARRMSNASESSGGSMTFEDEGYGSAEDAAAALRALYAAEEDEASQTLSLDSDEDNAYGQLPRA